MIDHRSLNSSLQKWHIMQNDFRFLDTRILEVAYILSCNIEFNKFFAKNKRKSFYINVITKKLLLLFLIIKLLIIINN